MKPTKRDILRIVEDSFNEEISTSIGYVGPDMPAAYIEGRQQFLDSVARKLYKYFPAPSGMMNEGGILNKKFTFSQLFK